ncbi:MAG: thioesterase [Pygmaiobacter sp.]
MTTFESSITVLQTECDLNQRFTIGGLLRATQQIGTDQCEALGVGTDYLLHFHACWLLAKVSAEVYGDIKDGDTLHIVTAPAAPVHAVHPRYTSFYNAAGNLLAAVDAHWVLADTGSRHLLRRLPEGMSLPFSAAVEQQLALDIVRAPSLTDCGSATATYSRVDLNRHLNNTRYADVVCDALPETIWDNGGYVKKAVIYYRNELPLGHVMTLAQGACDYHGNRGLYLTGFDGATRCFESNILY